jgi:hypothetical protein
MHDVEFADAVTAQKAVETTGRSSKAVLCGSTCQLPVPVQSLPPSLYLDLYSLPAGMSCVTSQELELAATGSKLSES